MAYPFSRADVRFLSSDAGTDALAGAAALPFTDSTLIRDLTRLRATLGDHAAAVAETVRLRRRAALKLGSRSDRWLLTDEALQQATPAAVAAHRARRLTTVGMHDLTCSIGADLAALADAAAAESSRVPLGSDLDPVRALMAAHNLAASGLDAHVVIADALTRVSRGLLGYADPARRDGAGRRITSVSTLPSVADLDTAHADRPPVLRLPPGIDYDALQRPGEVEIVSLDGGAREAVLWPPELATVPRRATVLSTGSADWEITSADPDDAISGPVAAGDILVDPDAAVVRAHLVRQYATRHGLHLLDPHLAYLAGPALPPGVRGFLVLDTAPYREKTVAGWARRDWVGSLEIKQRGTPVIPDDLRRRLRPALTGPTTAAATLVIARIGRDPVAYWCRAVGPVLAGP
ncbi:THUMP-like domain-containing protein [Nakamurella sp. GG22]